MNPFQTHALQIKMDVKSNDKRSTYKYITEQYTRMYISSEFHTSFSFYLFWFIVLTFPTKDVFDF